MTDLGAELDLAVTIAAEAADVALGFFHRDLEWIEKNPRDLVSVADRTVEAHIVGRLATAFPDDAVVGEEGGGSGMVASVGQRCWHVDPIDGTTNFLKGLPSWGISMGLADVDGSLLLGVVVLPVPGEVFSALRGGGATRNGVPIHASRADRLDRCVVAYALAGRSAEDWGMGEGLRVGVARVMAQALGTRMQGCSVADLTSVAMGRIDATVAGGMSSWDVAAGLLIAAEAGAMITCPDGSPSVGADTAFIASPPAVHEEIRRLLLEDPAVTAS